MNYKTTDEYGDYMREQKRDERIFQSQEQIQPCEVTSVHGTYSGWLTTDGKCHLSKEAAENWQYDLLRK